MPGAPAAAPRSFGNEPNTITGLEPRRRISASLEQLERGPANQVPSARALHRIDAGLSSGDAHRPGGHRPSRRRPASNSEFNRKLATIGKPWGEADAKDEVLAPGMQADDFVAAEVSRRSPLLEVGPVVSSRHVDDRTAWQSGRDPAFESDDLVGQSGGARRHGIVVAEERSVASYSPQQASWWPLRQLLFE